MADCQYFEALVLTVGHSQRHLVPESEAQTCVAQQQVDGMHEVTIRVNECSVVSKTDTRQA